jgi:ATP-dependent Lhr-like helicase
MYEGDTPNAERRAAALALDRDLLAELLGQEELRDLIDPGALEEIEADLQRLSDRRKAATADHVHDVLRGLGDLTAAEVALRVITGVDPDSMLEQLEAERRAVRMRIGGEDRWIAAEDAGLYRDAFGAVPPGGLPEVFIEPVAEPLLRITRRYAKTHGPFTTRSVQQRYLVDPLSALRELEREGVKEKHARKQLRHKKGQLV